MFQLIGFLIFVALGLYLDRSAKDFKDSIIAAIVLTPAVVGVLMSLVIEAIKYFV